MKSGNLAHGICASVAAVIVFLSPTPASAAPITFNGVSYQAVMVAPNYHGGPTFDDNLVLSRSAMASAFATWVNWRRGPGGNIVELPGNTGHATFLNAFTPFVAGGAQTLGDGDLFVFFYFGHGTPLLDAERFPALNSHDEALAFPDNTFVTDDEMRAVFNAFDPGVFKLFIDVSCFSGGMWNGNDLGGGGDLEQGTRTILMSSSRENQFTFAGGVGPRPWEPLFLVNLINTARFADHRRGLSIAEYYTRSATRGSALNASRFQEGDPVETPPPGNELWDTLASGDFESGFFSNVPLAELPQLVATPEPGTASLMVLGTALLALGWRKRRSMPGVR